MGFTLAVSNQKNEKKKSTNCRFRTTIFYRKIKDSKKNSKFI